MQKNRIFTDEELKGMATSLVERIDDAIDKGEKEEAKKLIRQMESEYRTSVYNFEDFVAMLISHIYQTYGDRGVEESLRYAAKAFMTPLFDALGGLGVRERVEIYAAFFRPHSGKGLKIEEDDEKVTIILNPCGSGARMVMNGYYDPPMNLKRVKKAQPITFGREDFPCYCNHCAVFHHIVPIEILGEPFPPIEVGKGPGDPCKWHFYKKTDEIDPRYYKQVGENKGAPANRSES